MSATVRVLRVASLDEVIKAAGDWCYTGPDCSERVPNHDTIDLWRATRHNRTEFSTNRHIFKRNKRHNDYVKFLKANYSSVVQHTLHPQQVFLPVVVEVHNQGWFFKDYILMSDRDTEFLAFNVQDSEKLLKKTIRRDSPKGLEAYGTVMKKVEELASEEKPFIVEIAY